MDKINEVVSLVLQHGYEPDGETPAVTSKVIRNDTETNLNGRQRFKKSNHFVTVGERKVCFYDKTNNVISNMKTYYTKNVETIGTIIKERLNGND